MWALFAKNWAGRENRDRHDLVNVMFLIWFISLFEARKEIDLFVEKIQKMFRMVPELLKAQKEDDFDKLFEHIEKYETASDSFEVEIANYLNQVSAGCHQRLRKNG